MKVEQATQYVEIALTDAAVATKGGIAAINTATGLLVPGAAGIATLFAIGRFDEDATGDGTAKVRVRLFQPLWLTRFPAANAPNNPTDADIGSLVYLGDGGVATTDADTGANSTLGLCWGLAPDGQVMVQTMIALGPEFVIS